MKQTTRAKAVREITRLADLANQYIAHHEPWNLVKDEARRDDVQLVCTQALNMYRALVIYLKPILPTVAQKSEAFLNIAPVSWADLQHTAIRSHDR